MSELKPCPMCGGASFVGLLTRKRWFCECEECGVSMISQNDKQAAIDQWNRRAIPADQVLVPRELLRQACSDDPTLRAAARNALKLRLHP